MSDLQCAATVLLVPPGPAEPSRALGRALRDARLAAIYTSPRSSAVRTAEVVGAETGLPVSVLAGLAGARGLRAELDAIADQHRGETVLVVSHTGAIRAGVPPMVGLGDEVAASRRLAGCAVVEVGSDADGWVLRSWAGAPGLGTGPDTWTEMRDSSPK
jgi:broad specificity phosphatase PhoE